MDNKDILARGLAAAKQAAENAYAPYSNFRIGAALHCEDGEIIAGCNMENASYGLTTCAERNAFATAIAKGQRKFTDIVIYTPLKQLIAPCGACRQVIAEFLPQHGQVTLANDFGETKVWTVAEMLPDAFTPAALNEK
ncbi:MAG: cytidine deaminase [Phenylobacterium sp.]|jgi:cytidine deaminase